MDTVSLKSDDLRFLYLPHKWVRIPADNPHDGSILINPELQNYEYWDDLSLETRQAIVAMWSSRGAEGQILDNPLNADILEAIDLGLLSTIKGM